MLEISNAWIFSLLLTIPVGMMLCAAVFLFRSRMPLKSQASDVSIELLVPIRNESPTLLEKLKQRIHTLQKQTSVACTLIDDGSSRAVKQILEDDTLHIIRLESGAMGSKKQALSKAVHLSKADWIITSDADTHNRPGWIDALRLHMKPGIDFIAAPVFIAPENRMMAQFTQCESLCLWTIALATQFLRAPLLCSGASLAFRRQAFLDSGGYTNHVNIPSGDDVLLMHQLWKRNTKSIAYCVDKEAACFTKAPENCLAWFKQRRRWISKTGHVQHPVKILFLALIAIWLYLPFALLWYAWPWAGLILAIETIWVVLLACFYSIAIPRFNWLLFRLTYPIVLPFVYLVRPGRWKAQSKP
jgi:cellulose synthase/poly-beta-1,6-N-acetylglucosamine synthase-like glycosyltransferase